VAVVAALGWQREQVLNVKVMGLVGYAGDGVSVVSACVHVRGWW